MESQKQVKKKGGTMRLGAYPCSLLDGTMSRRIYGQQGILERHRHRYEFNNDYRDIVEGHGMKVAGINSDQDLVEMVEIPEHPWFVGCQFHPEFRSRPMAPHPLFESFIGACLKKKEEGNDI